MTLQEFFTENPRIAIAFSGGTDSAYLAYMAKKYAKEMTAIYVPQHFNRHLNGRMPFASARSMIFR